MTSQHDAFTALNIVLGMSDMLLETDLDAEQRNLATTIRRSAEVLSEVLIALFARLPGATGEDAENAPVTEHFGD